MPHKNSDRRPVVPNPEAVAFAQQLVHQLQEDDRPRFVCRIERPETPLRSMRLSTI